MSALAEEIDHRLQRVPPAQARRIEHLILELLELAAAPPPSDPAASALRVLDEILPSPPTRSLEEIARLNAENRRLRHEGWRSHPLR